MLIGLVGKPNVGKSTFFKAATLADVLIANYPFATIKPNEGVGYVKVDCIDKEFNVQCNPRTGFCLNHFRFVPVKLMDVAGLVPGASKGKGLGNQFLDDLRQADVFVHIVDLSGRTNEEGKPAENYDVTKDPLFLEEELNLWFFGLMEKAWRAFSRKAQMEKIPLHEAVVKQFSGLKITEAQTKGAIFKSGLNPENAASWTSADLMKFATVLRELSKPMIIAANKSDCPKADENLEKLRKCFPKSIIIPCSAEAELFLRESAKDNIINYIPGENKFSIKDESKIDATKKKALEFIQKDILAKNGSTGVQEVLNKAVFELLKYIAIFPAGARKLADRDGNILPDCFLLPGGSTALDFAYTVHSDLGRDFIKAVDAKTKKIIGKEHLLKHRDALEIIT